MVELYIPANMFYPDLPGGALQYFRYSPYLRERDVAVTILTPKRRHHEESELEINGIQIRRLEIPETNDFLADLIVLTEFAAAEIRNRGLLGQACIHPIGTFAFTVGSIRSLWKIRASGIPIFRHFTEVPEPIPPGGWDATRRRLKERVGLSPYSRLLMCSHEMGRAFQALAGISGRRIEVIPNGIDREVFYPGVASEKPRLRRALGLPSEGPLAISVCSVVQRKGVDLLVGAWEKVLARHPKATLAIVGSDFVRPTMSDSDERSEVSAFIDRIRAAIARLSHPERVILTGEVSNVEQYYRAADLFVFASLREGLPSAVLEAMSSGLPSVLSPFHGFPGPGEEYGTPGTHFIPVSHDPNSIAEGVIRLLESPMERSIIGAAAAQWMEATQSMGRAAGQLASLYRSACRKL